MKGNETPSPGRPGPDIRARAEALARAAHQRAVAEGRVSIPARHLAACLASALDDYGPTLTADPTINGSTSIRPAPLAFCENHGPMMLSLQHLTPEQRWDHHDNCTQHEPLDTQ